MPLGIILFAFLPILFGSILDHWTIQSLVPRHPGSATHWLLFLVWPWVAPVIGWSVPQVLSQIYPSISCIQGKLYIEGLVAGLVSVLRLKVLPSVRRCLGRVHIPLYMELLQSYSQISGSFHSTGFLHHSQMHPHSSCFSQNSPLSLPTVA